MILQKEIRERSAQWRILPDTVEKDYVLGHLLAGFCTAFRQEVVFKGGTCLRKCYYPDYRFSEDLDFTSLENSFELTEKRLRQVCKAVEKHSGILFSPEATRILQHNNDKKGIQVRILYWGPNHSRNQPPPQPDRWMTRIKIEISTEEILLLSPTKRRINHPYSDELLTQEEIPCYTLHEMTAEKLRALVQRSYTAPRDFYDIYQLTNNSDKVDWQKIKALFLKKMAHKKIHFVNAGQLLQEEDIQRVRAAWSTSMAHQLTDYNLAVRDVIIKKVIDRIKENL